MNNTQEMPWYKQVPGRKGVPGPISVFCELPFPCALSAPWRPSREASKWRELPADWFPCFNSYLTWPSLAPFCFQIENVSRNEKNHHTQQWINNSCQLRSCKSHGIHNAPQLLFSSLAKGNLSLSCLFPNDTWRQQIAWRVYPIRHSEETQDSDGREWKEIEI